MATLVPGPAAIHAVITPECIRVRGREGAIDEAMKRARNALAESVDGWHGQGRGDAVKFHVVVTAERLP